MTRHNSSALGSAVAALLFIAAISAGLVSLGADSAAAEQEHGLVCSSAVGVVNWTADPDVDTYWIYRSTNGGDTYRWLGRTTGGTTTLIDPAPRLGARYQVHFAGTPRADCTTTSEPAPPACSSGILKAEDALLAGRFETGVRDGIGLGYVHVPRGTGGEWNGPRTNFVEFCATVAEPGDYRIDATVMAASAVKRSFYVTVDDGNVSEFVVPPSISRGYYTIPVNDAGALDPLPSTEQDTIIDMVTWNLDAGVHYIRFYLRRDGTRLAGIALTRIPGPPSAEETIEREAIRAIYSANEMAVPDLTEMCAEDGSAMVIALTCDAAGRVTSLKVTNFDSAQPFVVPAQIGDLTMLDNLYLYKNGISELPPEIGNLTNLNDLSLGDNQLTEIPPEIGNLTNLNELDLRGNQLVKSPPGIGNLTNLSRLDLRNNHVTDLPPEIRNLTNLKHLDLGSNRLVEFPPEIGSLTNLEGLNLGLNLFGTSEPGDNMLTVVPPEIGNLTRLRYLTLSGNQLVALPPEIGNLGALELLDLTDNHLASLPPELANLAELRYVSLQKNHLTGLPADLFSQVSVLDLRYNRLAGDVDYLSSLAAVEKLRIGDGPGHNNCLTATSPELVALLDSHHSGWNVRNAWNECGPSLAREAIETEAIRAIYAANDLHPPNLDYLCADDESLVIVIIVECDTAGHVVGLTLGEFDNPRSFVVPPEIGDLRYLTTLELRYVWLDQLPPEVGSLTTLTDLVLIGNQLTELPAEIGNLTNLRRLFVAGNPLTGVPTEIGNLTNLNYLALASNNLSEIPPGIGNLTNLATLDLWNNQFRELPSSIGRLPALTSLNLRRNELTGDVTVLEPLTDLASIRLADDTDGNDCLTTTSQALASALDLGDPGWDDCENP